MIYYESYYIKKCYTFNTKLNYYFECEKLNMHYTVNVTTPVNDIL
jgi:hypothetical protein